MASNHWIGVIGGRHGHGHGVDTAPMPGRAVPAASPHRPSVARRSVTSDCFGALERERSKRSKFKSTDRLVSHRRSSRSIVALDMVVLLRGRHCRLSLIAQDLTMKDVKATMWTHIIGLPLVLIITIIAK